MLPYCHSDSQRMEGGSYRGRCRIERTPRGSSRFACRLGVRESCAGRYCLETPGVWACGLSSGFSVYQQAVCSGERYPLPRLNFLNFMYLVHIIWGVTYVCDVDILIETERHRGGAVHIARHNLTPRLTLAAPAFVISSLYITSHVKLEALPTALA